MEPKANTSKEAVALRKAAFAFSRHEPVEGDDSDAVGKRLNRVLLAAAIAYADAASRDVSFKIGDAVVSDHWNPKRGVPQWCAGTEGEIVKIGRTRALVKMKPSDTLVSLPVDMLHRVFVRYRRSI